VLIWDSIYLERTVNQFTFSSALSEHEAGNRADAGTYKQTHNRIDLIIVKIGTIFRESNTRTCSGANSGANCSPFTFLGFAGSY
jgi:hypothetical protein